MLSSVHLQTCEADITCEELYNHWAEKNPGLDLNLPNGAFVAESEDDGGSEIGTGTGGDEAEEGAAEETNNEDDAQTEEGGEEEAPAK